MSVNAGYVLREYATSKINTFLGTSTFKFHPGSFASQDEADMDFGTYFVVPNVDYTQPYIHTDAIRLEIYLRRSDSLQGILNILLLEFNAENPSHRPALLSAFAAENIKLQDVVCRVSNVNNNSFIDATEYFVASVDILIEYVEWGSSDTTHTIDSLLAEV